MPDAILIFTFGPVQSFIQEARRAADLYVGSRILVRLAQAAGRVIRNDCQGPEAPDDPLIFPADLQSADTPNRLVAHVPRAEAEAIAQRATDALSAEWRRLADTAYHYLKEKNPAPDGVWLRTWERQLRQPWEVYWAIADWDGRDETYQEAFRLASCGLDGAKRTRAFEAMEEPGLKDSLSGRRTALHLRTHDARAYWSRVAKQVSAARLRPEGRERLDAVGAVKRFYQDAQESFLSTSSVAVADYVARLSAEQLADHRRAVERLLERHLETVRRGDPWPYDGDLLYKETFTEARLLEDHGLAAPDPGLLRAAKEALRALHEAHGRPSLYYAILALDGDGLGERIRQCQSEEEHRQLSASLSRYADGVWLGLTGESGQNWSYHAELIYNGGDDVLAMAPLSEAIPLARRLAAEFGAFVAGATASCGVAIAHHLYPLDATLRAAREAERRAKGVKGKAALCVRVLRRSGQTTEMRSPWQAMGDTLAQLVRLFREDGAGAALAGKLPYDLLAAAPALPQADDRLQAELRRLFKRHRNAKHPQAPDPLEWARRLRQWAASVPGAEPEYGGVSMRAEEDEQESSPWLNQTEELGRWLALAHWIAQGGRE